MNYVLVRDSHHRPLMPCHPARARELLNKGRASVLLRYPFTIVLHYEKGCTVQPSALKIDPGSKTTGIALTVTGQRGERCVMGIHLVHRGQVIKNDLCRRAKLRRVRRYRITRFRPARYLNRHVPKGSLTPSVYHRVQTTLTWVKRLVLAVPVTRMVVESVSFDTQKMLNKQIKGKEYQRGTLLGYKIREYLLYRYNHTCQYCAGVGKDPILEMEHVHPRSKGGADSIGNLTLACRTCNRDKGSLTLLQWEQAIYSRGDALSAARRKGIRRVLKGIRPSMKDAAAVNDTRRCLVNKIKEIGLPVSERSSYLTKYNRQRQGYRKDHFIDAAVLGGMSDTVYVPTTLIPMTAKAMGHGSRQMCQLDRYGFPRTRPKGPSKVSGFKTGDLAMVATKNGGGLGVRMGRIAVRLNKMFTVRFGTDVVVVHSRHCSLVQRSDGYHYYSAAVI